MKKRYLILLITSLSLFSCSKWLEVKPEDKFVEEDVFKQRQGLVDEINGIYLAMSSSNLYGKDLTMNYLDLLAQQYFIPTIFDQNSNILYRHQLITYNYEDQDVKQIIDNLWTRLYETIARINKLNSNLETYGSVLDQESLNLFKGEALGLRAYLYFDLIRMFTPAYNINPEAKNLPYYEQAGYEPAEFSSTSYVINKLIADLLQAEVLLKEYDPAINMGKVDQTLLGISGSSKPYLQYRNYRMNYYAVKALQARMYLWMGDKPKALAAAKEIIAVQSKFPWIKADEIENDSYPNRIFSTEMIFGFENLQLTNVYNDLFSPALSTSRVLTAGREIESTVLKLVFENWPNDFRLRANFQLNSERNFQIFQKYEPITSATANFKNTVAGLKISEIYLIAAECEENPTISMQYINELLRNRNCPEITSTALLEDKIAKEYRKEFYGEGQLWFYYKRRNELNILNATQLKESILKPEYFTFPIPLSETNPR